MHSQRYAAPCLSAGAGEPVSFFPSPKTRGWTPRAGAEEVREKKRTAPVGAWLFPAFAFHGARTPSRPGSSHHLAATLLCERRNRRTRALITARLALAQKPGW